jgi:hypothetical protein
MRLPKSEYDRLLNLLASKKDYVADLKYINYDKIYGVQFGNNNYTKDEASKVIDLIHKSYEEKDIIDVVNSTYIDYNSYSDDSTSVMLYIYNKGVKYYRINSNINPDLKNYIMQMQNDEYIRDKKLNKNKVLTSVAFSSNDSDYQTYINYLSIYGDDKLFYNYINNNIKSNIDFSKYSSEEVIHFNVAVGDNINSNYNDVKQYDVFMIKDETYQDIINDMQEEVEKHGISTEVKDKI